MKVVSEISPDSELHLKLNVIFGPEIWALQNQGGISRYFCELIKKCVYLNQSTYALIPEAGNRYISEIPSISQIKYKSGSDDIANLVSERFLNSSLSSIYHASYYSKLNYNKLLGRNFRTVITVHDLISEKFESTRYIRKPRINIRKRSIESADHIICISNNTKNDLIEHYSVDESKISVIYLGSNFISSETIRDKTFTKIPYLLFVGKRSGYKNFYMLIQAFANSKFLRENFRIVAVGGGMFDSNEISLLRNFNLENHVNQVDAGDEKLANYYSNAEALIYPSLYEGFGLPPIEAMALGCPVFASNAGSIPEVCGDAAIYFDPRNAEHLTHIIESSLSDSKLLKEITALGILKSQNFTWERTARETMMVYLDVAK